MSFPTFPSTAFINALGDADLVHIGRYGARPIAAILSIEDSTAQDGEYDVYVERITLDMLEKDASKLNKDEVIKSASVEYVIVTIPPTYDGMVEIVLERKV